jgi:hypothetical protein
MNGCASEGRGLPLPAGSSAQAVVVVAAFLFDISSHPGVAICTGTEDQVTQAT